MKKVSKKLLTIIVLLITIMRGTMEADAYIGDPESRYSTKPLGYSYATFCLTLYYDAVAPSITTGVIADCYLDGSARYVDGKGNYYTRYFEDSYAQCASWGPRYYLSDKYMYMSSTINFRAYDDDGNMASDTLTRALTACFSYSGKENGSVEK
ncbi:MAG: hypothetical protein ACI4E1_01210 [Lachnospira sp.]